MQDTVNLTTYKAIEIKIIIVGGVVSWIRNRIDNQMPLKLSEREIAFNG